MATNTVPPSLLAEAIAALGITAPIYQARITESGAVEITTRDGPATWHPGSRDRAQTRDDLTVIPQIGRATQDDLYAIGISTFAQLAAASTDLLLTVMTKRTLRTVHGWLDQNPPNRAL